MIDLVVFPIISVQNKRGNIVYNSMYKIETNLRFFPCNFCTEWYNYLVHHQYTHLRLILGITMCVWVRSGSVVECLTRDGGAAGSGLTSVTVLCP